MYVYMMMLLVRAQAALSTGDPSLLRSKSPRVRASLAKGPTFIEYAILAAIVVGIGILLRNFLVSLFEDLFNLIQNAVDGSANNS